LRLDHQTIARPARGPFIWRTVHPSVQTPTSATEFGVLRPPLSEQCALDLTLSPGGQIFCLKRDRMTVFMNASYTLESQAIREPSWPNRYAANHRTSSSRGADIRDSPLETEPGVLITQMVHHFVSRFGIHNAYRRDGLLRYSGCGWLPGDKGWP
ncbi:MAG: hypothetical protein AAFR47_23215, partial [Pseudomonadota bacterium]